MSFSINVKNPIKPKTYIIKKIHQIILNHRLRLSFNHCTIHMVSNNTLYKASVLAMILSFQSLTKPEMMMMMIKVSDMFPNYVYAFALSTNLI